MLTSLVIICSIAAENSIEYVHVRVRSVSLAWPLSPEVSEPSIQECAVHVPNPEVHLIERFAEWRLFRRLAVATTLSSVSSLVVVGV